MGIRKLFSRVSSVRTNVADVLSMNRRNLVYIYPNNERCDYPIADNKLATKTILQKLEVPHPETYQAYQYFYELNNLENDLEELEGFVIKPASGSGGSGIKVLVAKGENGWLDTSGEINRIEAIRNQISDIIFGVYSFDLHDTAIVEQRIVQHKNIQEISVHGLADVRIITCQHEPVLAMLRVPTSDSQGKSNLHQGAIGIGVDIKSGLTNNATQKNKQITVHPDSGYELKGIHLPFWDEVVSICKHVAREVPLKYLGFDIGLSIHGPVVLELNVRPGIEIQNANALGMRVILESGPGRK